MKYIFFDLDGTLLDSEKEISSSTVDYLKELSSRGIVLAISSGRDVASILPILRQAGLEDVMDVIVANCGADVYDISSKTMRQHFYFSAEELKEILKRYSSFEGVSVLFHNPDKLFASSWQPMVDVFSAANGFIGWHDPAKEDFVESARVEILYPSEKRDDLLAPFFSLVPEGVRGMDSDTFIFELIREENSKAGGIRLFVEERGDSLEDVMCIGDGENDLEMLEACGKGVAMKNAKDIVKKRADDVTDYDNDHEGVLKYLKKIYG